MKPIPNLEGYFADELGNIYTQRPKGRSKKWRDIPVIKKPQKQLNGYMSVNLMINQKPKTFHIHILVLNTFFGERPNGFQGCHGIMGKKDNSIKNLSWQTASKNNKEDKIRDGKFHVGQNHHRSKLTESDIKEIRNLYKQGFNNHEIANKFNVHHSNISKIIKGYTWSHVQEL